MITEIVYEHSLDEAAGIYRVDAMREVRELAPMTDDTGEVLTDDTDEAMTELRVVAREFVIDIVFAATDSRWQDRPEGEVRDEQIALVKAAIETVS